MAYCGGCLGFIMNELAEATPANYPLSVRSLRLVSKEEGDQSQESPCDHFSSYNGLYGDDPLNSWKPEGRANSRRHHSKAMKPS